MIIKRFENKITASPTERLTFKSEEEFNAFCNCIEGKAVFNRKCLAEDPECDYNKSLIEMLNRLKKKEEKNSDGKWSCTSHFHQCRGFPSSDIGFHRRNRMVIFEK